MKKLFTFFLALCCTGAALAADYSRVDNCEYSTYSKLSDFVLSEGGLLSFTDSYATSSRFYVRHYEVSFYAVTATSSWCRNSEGYYNYGELQSDGSVVSTKCPVAYDHYIDNSIGGSVAFYVGKEILNVLSTGAKQMMVAITCSYKLESESDAWNYYSCLTINANSRAFSNTAFLSLEALKTHTVDFYYQPNKDNPNWESRIYKSYLVFDEMSLEGCGYTQFTPPTTEFTLMAWYDLDCDNELFSGGGNLYGNSLETIWTIPITEDKRYHTATQSCRVQIYSSSTTAGGIVTSNWGAGNVTEIVPFNTQISSIIAGPYKDYYFNGWSDGSFSEDRAMVVHRDIFITANFDTKPINFPVIVAGTQVTSANYKDVLSDNGTVTYEPETQTLNLYGAFIESDMDGIDFYGYGIEKPFTINVCKSKWFSRTQSTILALGDGIYGDAADIIITSTSPDSSILSVKAAGDYYGINMDGNLTLKNATVIVASTESSAINLQDHSFSVQNSNLLAVGADDEPTCVYISSLSLEDCKITSGQTFSADKESFVEADNSITTDDVKIEATAVDNSGLQQILAATANDAQVRKVYYHGQFYILRDGKTYNMLGVQVKLPFTPSAATVIK